MSDALPDPAPSSPTANAAAQATPSVKIARSTVWLGALAFASLLLSGNLWFKLSNTQEALARQSADAAATAVEGRTLAKSAQDTVKELASRQALLENRVAEVALQRSQLDELMQSLSRSRDENLLVDVESALRLAQQQANLTGSLEPLLAALRSAEQRAGRSAQPRLAMLQRALAKDIDRIKSASVADTPSLLNKLDELIRLVDEMPLANAVAVGAKPALSTLPTRSVAAETARGTGLLAQAPDWVKALVGAVREDARALVRVSRIDTPEAALLTPEQSFFARENLKLKLLNARLGILSRQFESARSDLANASRLAGKYFDSNSRSVQQSSALLATVQSQLTNAELPHIDDTLAALATLSAATSQGK
jgi:uroporphyrin-III C-methyltransferase